MAKKSKVETSPHFNEIVDLLVAGYSGRYVSDYLQNKYDEKITHTTLNKYKKDNLNVKAAVKQKIIEKEREKNLKKSKAKSKEKANEASKESVEVEVKKELQAKESFEIATDYRYKDVQKLDNLIEESEDIKINLNLIDDPQKRASLQIQMKKLGLDAMKLKYDVIDEDELTVNVNDERIVSLSESLEKSRQEYLKEKEKEKK